MTSCDHTHFHQHSDFQFLADKKILMLNLTLHCKDCGMPFKFVGVPAGISLSRATTSFGGNELRVPVEPAPEMIPILEAERKSKN